ncbi:uncharacterized protein LOC131143708 [Malania oleifera]|uniref:uncharacterized protein LOC131143708 n=1 Tax=Malania oleifera TaxID=397392 RepID=UPI0025ADA6B7|nr:uncharacterized protein LOC131143708 [Malania oleifera]
MTQEQNPYQQISSNTSSGGGGGSSKNQKRSKIPQRGPGVAELEKILKEQHKREEANKASEVFHSQSRSVPLLGRHYHPQPSPIHHPPPPASAGTPPLPMTAIDLPSSHPIAQLIPSIPNPHDLFNPTHIPRGTLYGDGSSDSLGGGGSSGASGGAGSGGGGGVGVSVIGGLGSTMDCAGQGCLPKTRSFCQSNFSGEFPKLDSRLKSSAQFSDQYDAYRYSRFLQQKNHYQFPPHMVNVWPSARLDLQTEPPSNQNNCDSICLLPEEENPQPSAQLMVGVKRPWPYAVTDSTRAPPLHRSRVPHFSPDMQRPEQSSSCGSHRAFDFESEQTKTISRNAKRRDLRELKSQKCIADHAAFDGNILSLRPPINPTSSPDSSKSDILPFQISSQDTYQSLGTSGSFQQKPFYNFIPPREHTDGGETTLSLNNRRGKPGEDGINLDLKL